MFVQRMEKLRQALAANNIDTALIADDDAVYYLMTRVRLRAHQLASPHGGFLAEAVPDHHVPRGNGPWRG
jgi:hypothetical protein